jgi:hypothetical protein
MSGADKSPSEPPDLPVKCATTDRRPGGTTGRSGRGVHSRSRQTTCRGMISGGECTPSTTCGTELGSTTYLVEAVKEFGFELAALVVGEAERRTEPADPACYKCFCDGSSVDVGQGECFGPPGEAVDARQQMAVPVGTR